MSGLSLWGILATPVRSGLVGLGVGSLTFLVSWFGRRGLLAWLGLFTLLFITLPDNNLEKLLKFDQAGSYKRIDIWSASFSAVADRPFFGWGPGQFENAYWVHEKPQDGPVRFEMTTSWAHNDWLQLFVEGGFPAGLLAIYAFVLLWRSCPGGKQFVGIKSSCLSLAAFGLVNFPLALPACGVLIAILAGLTQSDGSPAVDSSKKTSRWTVPLKAIALVLFFGEALLLLNSLRGEQRSFFLDATCPSRVELIRDRLNQEVHSPNGPREKTVKDLSHLLQWNPHRAELWRDMGHYKSAHQNPPDLSGALACYVKALSLRPHQATWWMEKAEILVKTGDNKGAMESAERAIDIEPWYFDAALSLGYYYFQMGQIDEARKRINDLSANFRSWPSATMNDSGYRKTILHKNPDALRRAVLVLQ